MAQVWHSQTLAELAGQLGSDPFSGLSAAEAKRRLEEVGPNQLLERHGKGPWRIFLGQFGSTLVLLLIVAGLVSYWLGDIPDAVAIGVIVLLNSFLGFRQEYRAEKAVAALRRMSIPATRVRRGGETLVISSRELVPGDLVLIEAGDLVPADLRLVECHALAAQEAALTGESAPVEKECLDLPAETPLAERSNLLFRGTVVVHGRALALVCATAMATELGQVASLLQEVHREDTPLQKRLERLGRQLVVAALLLVGLVFAHGYWRGEDLRVLLLTAVSLAVAAVPEGLPAVVTIALALGAQRMLARNALIRRLPAVETLGSVTTICSDKTGTLTRNEMVVSAIDIAGQRMPVDAANAEARALLAAAVLCSDARRTEKGLVGDPTEVALLAAALQAGLDAPALRKGWQRVDEIPFDSARKRMATLHLRQDSAPDLGELLAGPHLVCVKGALESVLAGTTRVLTAAGPAPLDEATRATWRARHDALAADGQRVLAVAVRSLAAAPAQAEFEQDLLLLGLVASIDPPRDAISATVARCYEAGIRLVMITGDHPLTARAIAGRIGMRLENDDVDKKDVGQPRVLTGAELDGMDDSALDRAVSSISVYARVEPEHKLHIIDALKRAGQVVAMTGDGVNDAPALKRADIGVAMGKVGTDVAKEAADMVLLDDDFATILAAVEEGRRIYDNLRKFLKYLLASNVGEITVMLAGPFFGLPLPLLPLQILWINLITDGLPALALGFEPVEPHTMKRPPHPPGESLFARGLLRDVLLIGIGNGAIALLLGAYYRQQGAEQWQTVLFTVLVISQIALAVALRSERHGFWTLGLLTNKSLLAAVISALALQATITYLPALAGVFRLVPLGPRDLAITLAASLIMPLLVEVQKWFHRRRTA